MKFPLLLKGEKNWRVLIYGLIIVSAVFLLTTQAIASPISEEARWWVSISLGVAAIAAAVVIGLLTVKVLNSAFRDTTEALNSAFRDTTETLNSAFKDTTEALNSAFKRTESVIEGGFSQTHSTLTRMEETSVITALGSKGDRLAWNNFLQDAIEEAVDKHYLRITTGNPVTTSSAEELLPVNIQREIQGVVGENPDIPFEELAAKVVEKLHVRRLASLARAHRISLNEIIAVVAGFAGRIGAKE